MFESPFYQLTIEIIVGFFALFAVAKFIRKTQMNQVTPFDFISAIILGELVGNAIYDDQVDFIMILYAIILWSILMYIVEKVTQKFRRTRKLLDGDPAIIIRDGQVDYAILKKEKLDINELLSILRQKDVFSIREIEYGILEPSGSISVLKKPKYETPTIEDMKITGKTVALPINIILDGEVIVDNLHAIGFDEKWLNKQIRAQGVKNIEEVFFADWKKDEGIHVVKKATSMHSSYH